MTYDFRVAKLHLAYGVDKGLNSATLRYATNPLVDGKVATIASTNSRDILVGVTVPLGVHTILASYIHKDDRDPANQDANQFAVGYRYAMSKRTDLYSSYARISNSNGGSYTVGNATEIGSGDKALNIGVRHTF